MLQCVPKNFSIFIYRFEVVPVDWSHYRFCMIELTRDKLWYQSQNIFTTFWLPSVLIYLSINRRKVYTSPGLSAVTICSIVPFKPSITFLLNELHSSITFGMIMHQIMVCWIPKKSHNFDHSVRWEAIALYILHQCARNLAAWLSVAEPECGATASYNRPPTSSMWPK